MKINKKCDLSRPFFYFLSSSFILIFLLLYPAYPQLTEQELNEFLECFQVKMSTLSGKEKYQFAFRHYPADQLYKLFIDKNRLKHPRADEKAISHPKYLFDVHEPGYHDSMVHAFEEMSNLVGTPLSLDLIIKLHDAAVQEISSMKKGVAQSNYYYGTPYEWDEHAYYELFLSQVLFVPQQLGRLLHSTPHCPIESLSEDTIIPEFLSKFSPAKHVIVSQVFGNSIEIEKKLKPYFDHYETSIARAHTVFDKLQAISELLRTLEVAHFFPDGNQRTYSFLLLNKLLIENNIPPVILDDPFMFDGHFTVTNLANKILQGIANFLNECEVTNREFLNSSQCRTSTEDSKSGTLSAVTRESTYKPLYKKMAGRALVDKFQTGLRMQIDQNDTLKQKASSDEPTLLTRALMLNDTATAIRLLQAGADPFLDQAKPIKIAITKKAYPVLEEILKQMDRMEWDQKYSTHLVDLAHMISENTDPIFLEWRASHPILLKVLTGINKISENMPRPKMLRRMPSNTPAQDWTLRILRNSILRNRKEILADLIHSGIGISAIDPEETDQNALIIAASELKGDSLYSMLDFLLENGMDINQRDSNGFSVLSHAISNHDIPLAKYLLHKGAEITEHERYLFEESMGMDSLLPYFR